MTSRRHLRGSGCENLERRTLLSSVLGGDGTLTVTGSGAADTIDVALGGVGGTVIVTENGGAPQSFPAAAVARLVINAGGGNDSVAVAANMTVPAALDGGPGLDTLRGGGGDDTIAARDGEADNVDGGAGQDRAPTDSYDTVTGVEFVNPLQVAPDNQTKTVRVLVVNFDPLVPSEGNRHLYEIFGWNDPHALASGYETAMERASGGAVAFDIVEWRDVNDIPTFYNGTDYTPDQYVQNRRTNSGWDETSSVDVPRVLREQNVAPLVDSGQVDEVWFFSDHFFLIGGEAFMAGPGSFFINGPSFPDFPTNRAFAAYGFSYERSVAEMLHNTGHRTENHMARSFGGWNNANPTSMWDKFAANAHQSNGQAGVGNVHYPTNAVSDYDYGNTRTVNSWADDFLNYPNVTFATRPLTRTAWSKAGADYQREYLEWFYNHFPRAAGTTPDGRQNNWYKYLYDFNNYAPDSGSARSFSASGTAADLYNSGGTTHTFQVAYSSPRFVSRATLDGNDVRVTGPNGFSQLAQLVSVSDPVDDTHVVATYQIIAPGGTWDAADRGAYALTLQAGQVTDALGNAAPAGVLGAFSVRSAAADALPNDADTSLLLPFNNSVNGVAGEIPTASGGTTYVPGVVGQGRRNGTAGFLRYAESGNITARRGTIESWVMPHWNGSTNNVSHFLFEAGGDGNQLLLAVDGANNLVTYYVGDDKRTPAVEQHVVTGRGHSVADWVAGQWHHVALTWDADLDLLQLYLDGQPVGVPNANNPVAVNDFSGDSIGVMAQVEGWEPAQATADEFRISSRARSAGEIAADYRAGLATTSLNVGPAVSMAKGHTRAFTATAASSVGVTRDASREVAWSSSNPAVFAVDPVTGAARAVGAGTATLTARLDTLTATASVTVTDPAAPAGTLASNPGVSVAGATAYDFSVTYADNLSVNRATLGFGDVRVHGPGGFSQFASLVTIDQAGNGTPRTVTYRVVPRGGTWDPGENGTYRIEVVGWQVADVAGNWAAPASLGTFTVNVPQAGTPVPPTVLAVYVDSTAWTDGFRAFLESSGQGSAAHGFSVDAGAAQLDELPWTNLDRVSIRFSEDVAVQQSDLLVTGVNIPTYATGGFAYNAATFTATWTLADGPDAGTAPDPFGPDKIRLRLDGTGANRVADTSGHALDGEWSDGVDTFPSGDAAPGGDFTFRLNVLPGDVNRSGGSVIGSDVTLVRNNQNFSPGTSGYTVFRDVNGSASILGSDVTAVRNRQGLSLPAGEPSAASASAPISFGAQPLTRAFRPLAPARDRMTKRRPVDEVL